jgi:hypothetical protein
MGGGGLGMWKCIPHHRLLTYVFLPFVKHEREA